MSIPSPIATPRVARARKAALDRYRPADDPQVVEASRDLAAANLQHYIERVVAEAPPLTDAQCDRLASLLRVGGA